MQFSEQWLRSYADPPFGSDELAERLTMAGLEVESIDAVAPAFSGVVVGEVKAVDRHPNADKLTVCEVDIGAHRLSIVCGAPNVAPGIKAPCAMVGARLPGGADIEAATVRGVQSQGMLCSARELGMSDDHEGLLILEANAPLGADLRTYLALDDRKLTIKLTPDRADCLSVVGVAREVAALGGAPLVLRAVEPARSAISDGLPVAIEAPDLCGRFSGRVIRAVNARAPTPSWIKQRLEHSGQRPISALVDISNYVMLELGRPTHVFDLDKVQGGLTVRWGRQGERVELLNGQTVDVDSSVGVIADQGGVEALAGIMGGAATAVSLDTRNVYLEAAFWWPDSIRGRARRYNFSTDAAHRFERGVDFATNVDHIEYVTRLIIDVCGGNAGQVDDKVTALPQRNPVTMRIERCRRVLGIELGAAEIAAAFRRIGFEFEEQDGAFVVTPPSFRFDLEIEADLIGEVARLIGYEKIPAHPPRVPAVMRAESEERRSAHDVRRALSAAGYTELVTYSFVDAASERDFATDDDPIAVLNPIASQMSMMRSTLLGGLVSALSYNLNRKAARVRVFEIGRVYWRDRHLRDGPLQVAGIDQPNRVAGLAYGPNDDEQWATATRGVDFFDVKGDIERLLGTARFVAEQHPALHPGRSSVVEIDGRRIGYLGQLHPRLQQRYELPAAPIVFEVDLASLLTRPLPQHAELSRFQPVQRDLSVTIDKGVPVQAIVDAVRALSLADGRLSALREFRLFDVYRPPPISSKVTEASANVLLINEKNLAFRAVLQDTEHPVSDAQADAALKAIVEVLEQRFGARPRK
ncbi:MAG TPA: phenylalanine--tRNA ligase subunit beta [Burkholderiaceae bacterium]|nr:phenylalanine--tRNA ligase subunit beta [Burkholderiaceae bacterium]